MTGSVVDVLDQAVFGARLEAWHDEGALAVAACAQASSERDGSFRIRVPRRGRYLLRLSHPDFAQTANRVGIWVDEDRATEVPRWPLDSGLLLRGRVVDANSRQALAGVEVVLRPSIRAKREDHGLLARRMRTRADGAFSFTGLPPRRYTLIARPAAPHVEHRIHDIRARLPDDEAVVLRMDRGLRGSFRVVDAEGRAVEGAELRLEALGRSQASPKLVRTDAKGRAECVELSRGPLRIVATHGALRAAQTRRVPFRDELEIRLPESRRLSLRHRGVLPATRCRWRLVWQDHTPQGRWLAAASPRSGIVEIEGLPEAADGTLLELRVDGHAPNLVDLADLRDGTSLPARAASSLTLRFEGPGRLDLRGQSIELLDSARAMPAARAVVDRAGTASFEALATGGYWLRIGGRRMAGTIHVGEGARESARFQWPPPSGDLEVRIPPGLAAPTQLHVWASRGSFRELRTIREEARISFRGLPAGRFGLRLRRGAEGDGGAPPVFVEVLPGQSVTADLR